MTPHPEKMRILVVAGDAESARKTIELRRHTIPAGAEIIVEVHGHIPPEEVRCLDFFEEAAIVSPLAFVRLQETVPRKRASAVAVVDNAPEPQAPRAHQGLRERLRRLRQAERNQKG